MLRLHRVPGGVTPQPATQKVEQSDGPPCCHMHSWKWPVGVVRPRGFFARYAQPFKGRAREISILLWAWSRILYIAESAAAATRRDGLPLGFLAIQIKVRR